MLPQRNLILKSTSENYHNNKRPEASQLKQPNDWPPWGACSICGVSLRTASIPRAPRGSSSICRVCKVSQGSGHGPDGRWGLGDPTLVNVYKYTRWSKRVLTVASMRNRVYACIIIFLIIPQQCLAMTFSEKMLHIYLVAWKDGKG